jgi:hypothetical protein
MKSNDSERVEHPPKVDLKQLRQLTEQAIQRGKLKEEKRLAAIKLEEERKAKREQLFAETVLAEFPDKCEKEAGRGRSHAIIMGLKYDRDYTYHGNNFNILTPERLTGPAAIVWKHLEEAELKPTLEHWHDGMGIDGGFNIVVHW